MGVLERVGELRYGLSTAAHAKCFGCLLPDCPAEIMQGTAERFNRCFTQLIKRGMNHGLNLVDTATDSFALR